MNYDKKTMKILRNACRCKRCNTVIESKHQHDFVSCECGNVFTDGGLEYIRRGGDPSLIEDLSTFVEQIENEEFNRWEQ